MAEHQEAFTSAEISSPPQQLTAHAQSSMTVLPPGDSDSGITIVDVEELTRSVNNNETGTAASSRQMQEHQEPSGAVASLAQQPNPPTDERQSITIIIGEVDNLTRKVDEAEYNPHHVCIGPYHWMKNPYNNLRREEQKRASLRAIVQSAGRNFTEATEPELIKELEYLENKARNCYAHEFDLMDQRQFVGMLLLDGSYLLHLFGLVGCGRQGRNDAMANNGDDAQCNGASERPPAAAPNNNVDHSVSVRDVLYLAENQIPFFVLEKIHQLIVGASASASAAAVAGGMKKYVQELLLSQVYSVAKPVMNNPPGNLLHLLHMHLEPTAIEARDAGNNQAAVGMDGRRWRTATQYRYIADVNLKQRPIREAGAKCILDVKLRGGTLEVPCLSVDGQTCAMLRNLMALEKANPGVINSHVTAYCVFISQLACTAADVELLSKSLIINHTLGSDEEMARCFADLCKGINFDINDGDCNYLRATCQELETRFRSHPRRWIAGLHHKHFSNPWAIIGLASGFLVLLCTLVQGVFAVLGYIVSLHQSKNHK